MSINEVPPGSPLSRDNTNQNIVDNNAGVESDLSGNIKAIKDPKAEIPLKENKDTTAYCVRCKKVHKMGEPVLQVMKNGKHALKGKCETCQTTMFRIVKKEEGETVKTTGAPKKKK